MAENNWATPTMKEVPFWYDGISEEEYEKEREYYFKNFNLVQKGMYIPLWKQKTKNVS